MKTRSFTTITKEESGKYYIPPQPISPLPIEPEIVSEIEEIKEPEKIEEPEKVEEIKSELKIKK